MRGKERKRDLLAENEDCAARLGLPVSINLETRHLCDSLFLALSVSLNCGCAMSSAQPHIAPCVYRERWRNRGPHIISLSG